MHSILSCHCAGVWAYCSHARQPGLYLKRKQNKKIGKEEGGKSATLLPYIQCTRHNAMFTNCSVYLVRVVVCSGREATTLNQFKGVRLQHRYDQASRKHLTFSNSTAPRQGHPRTILIYHALRIPKIHSPELKKMANRMVTPPRDGSH